MFGIMGIGAGFINAAGRGGKKKENVLRFLGSTADPVINSLSCIGDILVTSTKNGEKVTTTYSNLSGSTVSIQADENTEIAISGDVIKIQFATYRGVWVGYIDLTSLDVSANTVLEELDCGGNTGITSLDVSANTVLKVLICKSCTGITSLDLSDNTELRQLECAGIPGITSLDLSANTKLAYLSAYENTGLSSLDLSTNTSLSTLNLSQVPALISIKYPATNNSVSTTIANAITNATAADGTVYTDSAAAYYSTIATAATTKGWTIEQL